MDEREWRGWAREVEENDSMAAQCCWRAGQAVLQMEATSERNALLRADTLHYVAQARAHIGRNTYPACALAGHNPQKAFRFGPAPEQMELFAPAGSAGTFPERGSPATVTA